MIISVHVCLLCASSSQSLLYLSTGDRMWAIFTNYLSATLYISSVSLLIIATLSLLFKPTKQITLIMSSRQNNTPAVQNNSGVIYRVDSPPSSIKRL